MNRDCTLASDVGGTRLRVAVVEAGDDAGLRGGFAYWMDSSRDAKGVGAGGS